MKSKAIWILAVLAMAVLGGAAIWMGGLNQDEGWYLYAANLVADGKIPYRDFAFTQGPVMPVLYARFCGIWRDYGLLGARCFNLAVGLSGILVCLGIVKRLKGNVLTALLLLGCNLYHLYYLAIPKTYALAGLLVAVAFYLLTFDNVVLAAMAGFALALAAGVRISMGGLLAAAGLWYLIKDTRKLKWLWLGIGGALGLALVYGPFVASAETRAGLLAAQAYHSAREGFDLMLAAGSLSRLVRWYLPVWVILAWAVAERKKPDMPVLLAAPLAVMAMQLAAPVPYEDYQVPLMGLVVAAACAMMPDKKLELPVFLVAMALAFGSPLLEKWNVDGQDRFWPVKKDGSELAQLRKAAELTEQLDPGGTTILTQDLYLAIETGRKVPDGLEMGPFSVMSHEEWRALLELTLCKVAALSGYTFAIEPPKCNERDLDEQLEFWNILKKRYTLNTRIERFGQNATTLLVLTLKEDETP